MEQPIEQAVARMVDLLVQVLGSASPVGMQERWPARLISPASDESPAHDQRPQIAKTHHTPGGNRNATEETGP
jgi:hypothetical protein